MVRARGRREPRLATASERGHAACPACAEDHPTPGATGNRLQRAARAVSLGGRASAGVAARLPPSRRPLRATNRPAAPGLCPALPPVPRTPAVDLDDRHVR